MNAVTDADREVIKAAMGSAWNGAFLVDDIERVYLAGLAAGTERAPTTLKDRLQAATLTEFENDRVCMEESAMDDPTEPPQQTLLERMAAVEKKSETMEQALRRAFGERWLDERVKAKDGEQ